MIGFFQTKSLGIEITDSHIKLCELQRKGKSKRIVRHFDQIELPEGVMNDGRVQDEEQLSIAFRKILDNYPWATQNAHFAIPSQTVMVRFLKLPNVNDKELRKVVDFEIKNNIHLPFDDPQYDFVKLEAEKTSVKLRGKSEKEVFQAQWEAAATTEIAKSANPFDNDADTAKLENGCDVMLTATSMALIQQYIRLFEDLGVQLKSIEIKAFSLLRLFNASSGQQPGELNLLADVNGTNCDLTIIRDGVIQITRNVPVSFVAQAAESADRLDQLFADFIPQTVNYENSFSDLSSEMERLMNFYRYTLNHRDAEFHKVIVSGDIPMQNDLLQYLSGRLSQTVIEMNWDALGLNDHSESWNLSTYAVPLGLCLRGRA